MNERTKVAQLIFLLLSANSSNYSLKLSCSQRTNN